MSLLYAESHEMGLERGGHVKGVAVAIVTNIKDPDGLRRVKVRYPWHADDRESYWARLAAPMAGPGRGVLFQPEVGDEVLVAFEREDLRFPYVIGALWNGKDAPPEKDGDGKNDKRVIQSRKGHRLVFDDGSKGAVLLRLNDGKTLSIDDDELRLDDGKGNRIVIASASGALTIEAKGNLTLKAASISLQASGSLELKAGANATLKGSIVSIN